MMQHPKTIKEGAHDKTKQTKQPDPCSATLAGASNSTKKSGLSRAEYCRQHQLSYHAATYWLRKLSKPVNKGTILVPVTFTPDTLKNPGAAVSAALKVVLPNKTAIEVFDDFSPITLTRLLATLEKR